MSAVDRDALRMAAENALTTGVEDEVSGEIDYWTAQEATLIVSVVLPVFLDALASAEARADCAESDLSTARPVIDAAEAWMRTFAPSNATHNIFAAYRKGVDQ